MSTRISHLSLVGVLTACLGVPSNVPGETVSSVSIKSEAVVKHTSRSYAPEQATGEPDTLSGSDSGTAWMPQEMDAGLEWLQVKFAKTVAVAEVRVRESFNPGAISKVVAVMADSTEVVLWEGRSPVSEAPCDLIVHPEEDVEANTIKIYLDTARVPGWNEIDAVALIGKDGTRQWAASATASSSYGSGVYGYGSGNELSPLLGTNVVLILEGHVVLPGKLLRHGTEFLALETDSVRGKKTIYVNRQKVLYIDPQGEDLPVRERK